MPGWHEALKEAVTNQEIVLLGVTQEQHPQRCHLFAQWKQFDWPILHDPINLLRTRGVPMAIALDEHGVVRHVKPSHDWIRNEFLRREFLAPTTNQQQDNDVADISALAKSAKAQNTYEGWLQLGVAAALWGQENDINTAIAAYQKSIGLRPGDGVAHFRLGVMYRKRYESSLRQEGDFEKAVRNWGAALEADPNQYIWRRRIQQYGPRLTKPYPFYDWIDEATAEISARGETPVALRVKPSGAEFAQPSKSFETAAGTISAKPDPESLILQDDRGLVKVRSVSVPAAVKPGEATRIHIDFRPENAKWNNELDPLCIWLSAPDKWVLDHLALQHSDPPKEVESTEVRRLELEVQVPTNATSGPHTISAYALYYVCSVDSGTCQFLRQDFPIVVRVAD